MNSSIAIVNTEEHLGYVLAITGIYQYIITHPMGSYLLFKIFSERESISLFFFFCFYFFFPHPVKEEVWAIVSNFT